MFRLTSAFFCVLILAAAADIAGSKDPPGMKRYEGSEIIGYRAPKFDEYLLPLGYVKEFTPPKYEKSLPLEGQVSRYTYIAPAGRSTAEVYRNYKSEFQRLGLETLFEKAPGKGWFGPTMAQAADQDGLAQILSYNEAEERFIVGKNKDANPTYYVVFVTAYKDGVIPERLQGIVQKTRVLVNVTVVVPDVMEQKMTFVNADEMTKSIHESGKVALYGLYFDTGKDVLQAESQPTLQEIAKLLKGDAAIKIHVVDTQITKGKRISIWS